MYKTLFGLLIIPLLYCGIATAQTANPNDPNDYQYVFLEAGIAHSVSLKCDGTVWTWGDNSAGQLGNNNNPTDSDVPVQVVSPSGAGTLTGIIAVSAGNNHTLALRDDGTVWTWGDNGNGQLADGTFTGPRNFPVKVVNVGGADSLVNVVAIAAGGDHSLAILADGSVVSWGLNNNSQLCDQSSGNSNEPVFVIGIDPGETAYAIAAGDCHTMVLQSNGRVKTCGCDAAGQLGDDQSSNLSAADSLQYVNTNNTGGIPLENIIGIAAGNVHSLAVDNTGEVYSWGGMSLGSGNYVLARDCSTPDCKYASGVAGVEGGGILSNVVAVAAGDDIGAALLADSTIMVWGENDQGQLGLGSFTTPVDSATPNLLTEKALAIGAGGPHMIAFLDDDSLKTWGDNLQGQVGNATSGTDENTPVTVFGWDIGRLAANAGPDTSYCSGDSVQIGEPPAGGFDYTWSPIFGLSDPNIANPYVNLTVTTSITIQYIVTKTSSSGSANPICIVPDTVNVTVIGNDAVFTSTAPACVGEAVNFYAAAGSPGLSYVWDFGQDAVATFAQSIAQNPAGVTYTTTGAKTVTLTIISSLGCTAVGADVITINPLPLASFTSTATTMSKCTGDTVSFTADSIGSQISHIWDFGLLSFPSSSAVESPAPIIYLSDGPKVVTHMVTSQFGCIATDTLNITINEMPTSSFTSNAPSCTGSAVDFANTGTTGATYAWTFPATTLPPSSTDENPTGVVFDTTGGELKSVVLVTTLGSCLDSSMQVITITETPAPGIAAVIDTCEGSSITFVYTGNTGTGWTYDWDFGTGASPTGSSALTPPSVMYTGPGTKTVNLTVSNGLCSGSTSQSFTINPTPVAGFTSTAPACTGDSVDFANTGTTGATSYGWTFGSGSLPTTSSAENPTSVEYSSDGIKTVTLTTTVGTCVSTATQTINIIETPVSAFAAISNTCEGVPIDFAYAGTPDPNWTYQWDLGDGADPPGSTVQDPAGVTYTGAGIKTVTLIVANGSCTETFSQTHTILETPVASLASTAPSCTGDSVDFTNTGSTGGSWTYSWDFDQTGSSATPDTSSAENPVNVVYSTEGTKLITLIVTDGTCSDTIVEPIDINLRPSTSFNSTVPECAGVAINFGNTGSTGTVWSYLWDFGGNATPATSNAENPTGVVFATGGIQIISFTISDLNCSEMFTDTINVDTVPSVNAGLDTTICADLSVQIGSANVANITYSWFPSDPDVISSAAISNPVATPVAPVTIYILTVTDTNGCMNTDSVIVTMLNSADVDAGTDVEICWGDTVQLGLGLIEGQTYLWNPTTGLDNPAIANPMANPTATTIYTVSVSFESCPTITDDVLATVHPIPDAQATDYLLRDTAYITLGSSIQLIATGGLQYEWAPANGLSNPGIYNPVAAPDSNTNYIVTVVDLFGCVNTDTVRVEVDSLDFFIPTAFTPDGNGFNDVFMVRAESLTTFELIVFDRWSEKVFISVSVSQGWDGRMQGTGEKMPEGAYVYSFKGTTADGQTISEKI